MSGLRPFSTYSSSSGGTDGSVLCGDEAEAWRVWRERESVFLPGGTRQRLVFLRRRPDGVYEEVGREEALLHFAGKHVAARPTGGVVGGDLHHDLVEVLNYVLELLCAETRNQCRGGRWGGPGGRGTYAQTLGGSSCRLEP